MGTYQVTPRKMWLKNIWKYIDNTPLEVKVELSKNNLRFIKCSLSFRHMAENTIGDYVIVSTLKKSSVWWETIGKYNTRQWHVTRARRRDTTVWERPWSAQCFVEFWKTNKEQLSWFGTIDKDSKIKGIRY